MAKNDRLIRLLKLLQAFQANRPTTVEELATMVGVSRRTVFRDLRLLAAAGIEYSYNRETQRYAAAREMLLPPVTLTHAEALTLMLGARYVANRRILPGGTMATSASLKLESMIPASIRDYCGPLLERTEIRSIPVSDAASITETISLIQSGLREQKVLHVKYDSYHDQTQIEVDLHPCRLLHMHRGWYLIAFTEQFNEVRTYKVERILHLKVLDAHYEWDRKFNLDDYFGNAWLMIRGDERFHVKIRFLPRVAANVDEVIWHKTQVIQYEEDGSLIFEVDVDGLEEISWWILGYGDQAQVLEPTKLRELIAKRVKGMYAYYQGHGMMD